MPAWGSRRRRTRRSTTLHGWRADTCRCNRGKVAQEAPYGCRGGKRPGLAKLRPLRRGGGCAGVAVAAAALGVVVFDRARSKKETYYLHSHFHIYSGGVLQLYAAAERGLGGVVVALRGTACKCMSATSGTLPTSYPYGQPCGTGLPNPAKNTCAPPLGSGLPADGIGEPGRYVTATCLAELSPSSLS